MCTLLTEKPNLERWLVSEYKSKHIRVITAIKHNTDKMMLLLISGAKFVTKYEQEGKLLA